MFFLALIMMPLATTEIGTDGWITGIMEGVAEGKFHPGWVLVYTSLIMMVLRFNAGPIIRVATPLGLLIISSVLAIVGLITLSTATGLIAIFSTATLYAVGKTFLWPTMLGVVAEQTPRGGALTLNAISGIGMLTVGTLGFPFIGALQAGKQIDAVANSKLAAAIPGLVEDGKLTTTELRSIYEVIHYEVVDQAALDAELSKLPVAQSDEFKAAVAETKGAASQRALGDMAIFPAIMLVAYIALFLYFRSKGGYKPLDIEGMAH